MVDPSGHCGGDPNNNNPFDADGNLLYNCTLDNFQTMSMELRLRWIQAFMAQSYRGRAQGWFNNIQGIIEGFIKFGLGEPGTWLSYVDAGILHSIQDGYALYRNLGGTARTDSSAWKDFFSALYQGTQDDSLVSLWGAAELLGTRYGKSYAADRGLAPNGYEQVFLFTGDIYRGAAATQGGLGTVFYDIARTDWIQDWATWFPYMPALTVDFLDQTESGMAHDLGQWFNDPRSTFLGHSPVYWYSTQIWRAQEVSHVLQ